MGILSRVPESDHLGLEFRRPRFSTSCRIGCGFPGNAQRLAPADAASRRPANAAKAHRLPGRAPVRPAVVQRRTPARANAQAAATAIRASDLDPTDLEFIRILLNEPTAFTRLIPRIGVSTLRDAPLRAILQACYDLQADGQSPSYENVMVRLDDPAIRGLVAGLARPLSSEYARSGALFRAGPSCSLARASGTDANCAG